MTTPDPDPRQTPGISPGGDTPPGETPPAEGGIYGISHPEPLRKGWGPMPLILIMVVVALIAIGLIGMAVVLIA